jgi:succinate-semialdehyde dehydrogenase/glutarate-semialdehyde dehydrogenase
MLVELLINGRWRPAGDGATRDFANPATGATIGQVASASLEDLEEAVQAAHRTFPEWRDTSAYDRSAILRRAADLARGRVEDIAVALTCEQGKPLQEARFEIMGACDMIDWFAEEGRRAYGRIVPGRSPGILQQVIAEPVGPVAAFAPWNFPIAQIARKLGAALAAGCSIVVKAPEEAPASSAAFLRCFEEAGVPAGTIALVFGVPAAISEFLVPHPHIRKISFTGSTAVGKIIAGLAGANMKRSTMELGGHGPVIVCEDADVAQAVDALAVAKFRNAGQVCSAPTRFIVHEAVYEEFLERFIARARALKVGDGADPATTMGPLAHPGRLAAMERMVLDAVDRGAIVHFGGRRLGNAGCFFEPTILANTPTDAAVMNEEPFGPIALMSRFVDLSEALAEANRLDYGLAAYAFTSSAARISVISRQLVAGSIGVNHMAVAVPELPFGGVRDSGHGAEGGSEGLSSYLVSKVVSSSR